MAPPGERQAIAALIAAEGVAVSPFDAPSDLLGCASDIRFSLAVWRLEDEDPTPTRRTESLREHLGDVPILLVCREMPRWKLRKLLAGGVAGIVFTADMAGTIGPCLQAVLAGQTCVPSRYGDQIEPPVLSSREKQVLSLVVLGYMNSQIAQQLFLAESTVKSHLSSAFAKLGVRSRNEAVELIVDPQGGLGTGILALGGEPLQAPSGDDLQRDEPEGPAAISSPAASRG
jgi:DNA-binding NarL/FixJ family response regulator